MYESFRDYVAVETLKEENKYDAGDLGMQVSWDITNATSLPCVGVHPALIMIPV